eukprot:PITA_04972
MENQQGRGEIPSYKNVVAGETSTTRAQRNLKENSAPVMGNLWKKRMGGKCLPRAQKHPRYVIPCNKPEEYTCYMKDHALICKFIGYWPTEKELNRWIHQRWRPKGHIDLKLGVKGFFTAIFANLEDKERVFEEGPYFMNNVGLFMKHWEERYNPENERMLVAPIWVRLFGLPKEFWDPEILEGIGNTIGGFVKIAEATKRGKFNSYARLCVYMNISEPLPESIELEYHDDIWKQPIDYEHIPFRCRKCHEYGHLYRQCPLNKEEEFDKSQETHQREAGEMGEVDRDFQQVSRRKKRGKEGPKTQTHEKPLNTVSQNKFHVLQNENEDYEVNLGDDEELGNTPMEVVTETKGKEQSMGKTVEERVVGESEIVTEHSQMEVENQKENEVEEQKIMKQLIQEWKNLDNRFITEKRKQLYKEAFQKYKEKKGESKDKQLIIASEQENDQMGMDVSGKNSRKRGRKTLSEAIQTVGETLINSGKVIPLSEETKISVQQLEEIINKNKLQFEVMGQDAIGSTGGLAILWNPNDVILEGWTSMTSILTGIGRIVGTNEKVVILGVYGPPTPGEKENFMQKMKAIHRIYPEPAWIIGGDFNLIRSLEEKKGGIRKADQYMSMFNDMIDELRLVDIHTINGICTWNNRRGGKNQIASRLDHFLVSEPIMTKDVFIEAKIIPFLGSNRWPIRLEVDIKKNCGRRPFRFESFWLRDPGFIKKMEEWWTQSSAQGKGKMHTFQLKLKELKGKIKQWNNEEFGNILEEKQKLEGEMESLQQKIIIEGRTEESIREEGIIPGKLEERQKQEEVLWRQNSRIKWLREGERNNKFFHQAMIQHRQRNRILSIKD